MPGRITRIEPQKRRKGRFSVFVDDQYAFSVDADLLVSSGIAEGDEIDEERLAELRRESELRYARERAYRLLAVRDRSEQELRQRLARIGFAPDVVEATISVLKRQKYLDDRSFAERFARSQLATRPIGRRELERQLLQKGLNEELVRETLDRIYQDETEDRLAWGEALRRIRRYRSEQDRNKVKNRVVSFLARRGFDWQAIQGVLDRWEELEHSAQTEDGQGNDEIE